MRLDSRAHAIRSSLHFPRAGRCTAVLNLGLPSSFYLFSARDGAQGVVQACLARGLPLSFMPSPAHLLEACYLIKKAHRPAGSVQGLHGELAWGQLFWHCTTVSQNLPVIPELWRQTQEARKFSVTLRDQKVGSLIGRQIGKGALTRE